MKDHLEHQLFVDCTNGCRRVVESSVDDSFTIFLGYSGSVMLAVVFAAKAVFTIGVLLIQIDLHWFIVR